MLCRSRLLHEQAAYRDYEPVSLTTAVQDPPLSR
jgi:hypothetical protein